MYWGLKLLMFSFTSHARAHYNTSLGADVID
jgi:hypothetical protein